MLLWRQNPLISGCVTQEVFFCLFMMQEVSYKRGPSLYMINLFNSQGLSSKISNKYDYMLLEVNTSSGKDADAALALSKLHRKWNIVHCTACFSVKCGTVFIYTLAAHDSLFPLQMLQNVSVTLTHLHNFQHSCVLCFTRFCNEKHKPVVTKKT